jgi:hypothetical protein
LEVQNKANLSLKQRKIEAKSGYSIKSRITTLATVHPNIAGI